jgi:hypothetical protein
MSRLSKIKLIAVIAVIALIILIGALSGSTPSPKSAVIGPGTVHSSTTSSNGGTQVPNFGANGPTGVVSGTATAQALAQARAATQGVDPQQADPVLRAQEGRAIAAHPLYQHIPVSESGVTLSVGVFGDTQRPGISVVYAGSLKHAREVAAQVFARYHDQERDYRIQYSAG